MAAPQPTNERPQCGSGQPDDYNTGLQVVGLFLILILSVLSCSFALAVKRIDWIPNPQRLLFFCRHLGTGVIIATSFVHLLPTAFQSLLNPCLPKFWTEDFPAITGVIVMLGAVAVASFEMILAGPGLGHTHQSDLTDPQGPAPVSRTPSEDSDIQTADHRGHKEADVEQADTEQATAGPENPDNGPQLALQCVLLEAGILFHSIFIGMSIAFSTGKDLTALLIAISFHQIFEGMALGGKIAEITTFSPGSLRPWLMALAFGITAPMGQAIGLAVHGNFDLQSQAGLVMVGVANAFSSGLLIYLGLVQLFYEDFMSGKGKKMTKWERRGAYIALLTGCILMSVIGAFA